MATTKIDQQSFGQAGAAYVTAVGSVTGSYCAITSLDDATYFTSLTWSELNKHRADGSAIANTDVIHNSDDTIPKGVTIYGQITGFTLGAGRLIAYNAV